MSVHHHQEAYNTSLARRGTPNNNKTALIIIQWIETALKEHPIDFYKIRKVSIFDSSRYSRVSSMYRNTCFEGLVSLTTFDSLNRSSLGVRPVFIIVTP